MYCSPLTPLFLGFVHTNILFSGQGPGGPQLDSAPVFSCPYCDNIFSHKGRLNRHIRYHMGLKAHACPCCDAKFVEKYNLNRHIRLRHTSLDFAPSISCDDVGADMDQSS